MARICDLEEKFGMGSTFYIELEVSQYQSRKLKSYMYHMNQFKEAVFETIYLALGSEPKKMSLKTLFTWRNWQKIVREHRFKYDEDFNTIYADHVMCDVWKLALKLRRSSYKYNNCRMWIPRKCMGYRSSPPREGLRIFGLHRIKTSIDLAGFNLNDFIGAFLYAPYKDNDKWRLLFVRKKGEK
jgi:hypothetical protein